MRGAGRYTRQCNSGVAQAENNNQEMKLIGNLIGCIIGILSLILLSVCVLLFALLGREAYRWSREKMKNQKSAIQNRWKSVKSRYAAIGKVASRYVSMTIDVLFLSSKKITKNTVRFVLMWSLPTVFILSVVPTIHIKKEEEFLEKERMIEFQQWELDLLKREHFLRNTLDSLNLIRTFETQDTITRK